MMMQRVYVLGDGPYAKEVIDQLNLCLYTEVVFLSSEDNEVNPKMLVVGIANPIIKKRVIETYLSRNPNQEFIVSIHNNVEFGKHVSSNCSSMGPFTSVGRETKIADFVSICANVTIGHDVVIGKYSTICPGAVISGNVSIGEATFIGASAVIKNNVSIGSNVTVGCGAVVVKDVPGSCVAYGNPAKVHGLNNPAWRNKA